MKARWEVRRLSKAESLYLSRQASDTAFPAVTAAVLFVLYRYRHWHKADCVKLYEDVCALLSMPPTTSGSLDDEQVCSYLEKQLGIDFDKIRKAVKIE